MEPLVTPTVNLNGTDRQSLVDAVRRIMDPLRTAQEAVSQAMPHNRDYHMQEDQHAGFKAREAFRERWLLLGRMIGEFEAYAVAIDRQGRERRLHIDEGGMPGDREAS